jgi:hypothetical protein
MKKYLLLILVVLFYMSYASAQVDRKPTKQRNISAPKVNRLRDKGRARPAFKYTSIGYYGSCYLAYMRIPMINYSNFRYDMKNPDALEFGANGAVLVRPWLGVGLAFSGYTNKFSSKWSLYVFDIQHRKEWRDYISGYFGGIFIEPTILHRKPVHMAFPIILGYGQATDHKFFKYTISDTIPGSGGLVEISDKVKATYLMIEPGIEVEFNAYKFIRIGAGIKYRITSGVSFGQSKYASIPDFGFTYRKSLLDGLSYHISFKFGKF